MILLLVTLGSRGDVEPFVALGRALVKAGHEVRLATQQEFSESASGTGVDLVEIDMDSASDLLGLPEAREVVQNARNLRAVQRLMRALTPQFERVYQVTLAAAAGADAVLCHPMIFPALDVADHLGLPVVQVHHVLAVPTREFPSPTGSRLARTLGPVGNRASYALDRRLAWRLTGRIMNRLRRRVLGRPPLSTRQAMALHDRRVGAVVGVSPHVLPPPSDWPADVVTTGYLRSAGTGFAALDPATEDFLRNGPRPIFITLGSTPVPDANAVTRIIAAAARAANLRVILQHGTAGLGYGVDPNRIHVVGDIAYDKIIERVEAVVHHAGAGTLAQALLHGRPALALPSFGDQFFWGHRIPAIGVGPRPLPLKRLTVTRLTDRLMALTTTASYATRAREIGAAMRIEDGPTNAATAVNRLLIAGGTNHGA
jgi:UDP:flavonoid glycosyltransferase YjiC (YdhE family)